MALVFFPDKTKCVCRVTVKYSSEIYACQKIHMTELYCYKIHEDLQWCKDSICWINESWSNFNTKFMPKFIALRRWRLHCGKYHSYTFRWHCFIYVREQTVDGRQVMLMYFPELSFLYICLVARERTHTHTHTHIHTEAHTTYLFTFAFCVFCFLD